MEPVPLRHVAAGDGDEAGQPRLGGEQVVERGVEHAGTVGVGEAIADREQVPRPVVQEAEAHLVGEGAASIGQREQRRRLAIDVAGSAAVAAAITRCSAARKARVQRQDDRCVAVAGRLHVRERQTASSDAMLRRRRVRQLRVVEVGLQVGDDRRTRSRRPLVHGDQAGDAAALPEARPRTIAAVSASPSRSGGPTVAAQSRAPRGRWPA